MLWYIQYLWWLAKAKFERNDEEGREALDMENFSINICDGSELELA